jgi:hypothetical protein
MERLLRVANQQWHFLELLRSARMYSFKNLYYPATLCLSLLAGSAGAQTIAGRWTIADPLVAVTYRLDANEGRKLGRYLEYWLTVDFDYAPQFDTGRPYRSARILRRADCAAATQDTMSILQFDAPAGQGNLVWAATVQDDALRLEPVEPGSSAGKLLAWACSAVD